MANSYDCSEEERAARRLARRRQRKIRRIAIASAIVAAASAALLPLWPVSQAGETPTPVAAIAAPQAAMAPPVAAPAAQTAAPARPVYPYSIIPGGVMSRAELAQRLETDKVAAAHYASFDVSKAHPVTVRKARAVHVSYRKGDQIYWTAKKVMLAEGETLLSDGNSTVRTRCANRISDVPQLPVEANGPSIEELDTPVAQAGSAPDEGAMMNVAHVPELEGATGGTPVLAGAVPAVAPQSQAQGQAHSASQSRSGSTFGQQATVAGPRALPTAYGGRLTASSTGVSDDTGTPSTPPEGNAITASTVQGGDDGSTTSGGTPEGGSTSGSPTSTGGTTPGGLASTGGTSPGGTGSSGGTTPGGTGSSGGTTPGTGTNPPATDEESGRLAQPGGPAGTPTGGAQLAPLAPVEPTEVPEPGTLWLGGAAFAALLVLRRPLRRRKKD